MMRDRLTYLRDLGYEDLYRARIESPVDAQSSGRSGPSSAAARADESLPDRQQALDELCSAVQSCEDCALAQGRQKVVFGSGRVGAGLMFVGEAPGAHEDRQGLPFVGPAGDLLTRIIEAIDLKREEVYIANIVKCRPPRNRDPLPEEAAACRGYLERQVRLVQPRVMVALGRVAAQTLLGTDESLGRLRGQWFDVLGVPTRVTYHPAALLRNASYKRPTWEDMQIVRDRLLSMPARSANELP